MKPFMDENFLLQTETARRLYHQHAKTQPIIDYHCHLNPAMIADNHRFQTITELWLGGDHYKWRAMRVLLRPRLSVRYWIALSAVLLCKGK